MTRQPIPLTPETMQRTREHFVDIYRECIAEAESGKVWVRNVAEYREWMLSNIADTLAGKSDHTFTFFQRAHWLQTGECVALIDDGGEF